MTKTDKWLEGFVEAANAAGVTDTEKIAQLLQLASDIQARERNPVAFDEGYESVIKQAGFGLGKAIIKSIPALTLAGGGLALGMSAVPWWRQKRLRMGEEALGEYMNDARTARSHLMAGRQAGAGTFGGMGGYPMYPYYGPNSFGYGY